MKVRCIIKRTDERVGHVTNISISDKNLRTQLGGDYTAYEFEPTLEMPAITILSKRDVKALEPINARINETMKEKPIRIKRIFRGDLIVIGPRIKDTKDDAFDELPITIEDWKRLISGEASY